MQWMALNATPDNMEVLLDLNGSILISEEVLTKAVSNKYCPLEMTALLLRKENTVTTGNLSEAAFATCDPVKRSIDFPHLDGSRSGLSKDT